MKIIVDTSVWIDYLNNRSASTEMLDQLLLTGKIFIVGPIIAELLQGAKTEKDYRKLENNIDALPFIDCSYKHWVMAGEISFKQKKKGITIPITDCIIAAIAISNDASVMTKDRHFNYITQLKLEKLPE